MKKITFYVEEKKFVDFKIRLKNDGLSQKDFFSCLMSLYTSGDAKLYGISSFMRDKYSFHSKSKNKKTANLERKANEIYESINLSEKEKSNIFDILDKELGDM